MIVYGNRFFGELEHRKPGGSVVKGEINGDIKGDTLIGDYHYRPYRWKEKKRVPIALFKDGDNYIEARGKMLEVMGILTYIEHTIKYDSLSPVYVPIVR